MACCTFAIFAACSLASAFEWESLSLVQLRATPVELILSNATELILSNATDYAGSAVFHSSVEQPQQPVPVAEDALPTHGELKMTLEDWKAVKGLLGIMGGLDAHAGHDGEASFPEASFPDPLAAVFGQILPNASVGQMDAIAGQLDALLAHNGVAPTPDAPAARPVAFLSSAEQPQQPGPVSEDALPSPDELKQALEDWKAVKGLLGIMGGLDALTGHDGEDGLTAAVGQILPNSSVVGQMDAIAGQLDALLGHDDVAPTPDALAAGLADIFAKASAEEQPSPHATENEVESDAALLGGLI